MKKILCLVLATISIFSLILPVFAADGEQGSQINTTFDISKSTISEDFQKVFGGDFDVDDYPYNPLDIQEDNIYLITCVENKVHSKSKSEMYFYIYNPTKKKLVLNTEKNQVRGWYSRLEDERTFGDYELKYVCSEADGVLMKFKADGFFTGGAYDQDERVYFISGIELTHVDDEGVSTVKEYTVAQKYTFRDNEFGFVMQSCEDIDTVQTEVKHTYVRYYNPDNIFQAFDLQSVYFNISNEIITFFLFTAEQDGIYEFSIDIEGEVGYYGAPLNALDHPIEPLPDENGVVTLEIKKKNLASESTIATPYLIGIKAKNAQDTSCSFTIKRASCSSRFFLTNIRICYIIWKRVC